MVFVETVYKVITNYIAACTITTKSICNKSQIFLKSFFSINLTYKLYKAVYYIIVKAVIITDWNNGIFICFKSFIIVWIKNTASKNKTFFIQRVTTKHTAYSVANEGFNVSFQVRFSYSYIFFIYFWC